MNREQKRNLKKVAHRIAKLEQRRAKGEKGENVENEIEELFGGLNIEEMLYVDEYIMKSKILTN